MNIHEKIKSLRIEKGLTQRELAARIPVSPRAVFDWENGTVPRPRMISRLSLVFSVKPSYLINDSREPNLPITAKQLRDQAMSLRKSAAELDLLAEKMEAGQ